MFSGTYLLAYDVQFQVRSAGTEETERTKRMKNKINALLFSAALTLSPAAAMDKPE